MPVFRHPLDPADAAAMQELRATLAAAPKLALAPVGRVAADEMMAKLPAAEEIALSADIVGGVPGWWCRPADADPDVAILYLHGGAYVVGSAWAYRPFASRIAAATATAVFVADYALAPERRFPAAFHDAAAAYDGLAARGVERIALCGDSAGGGLMLALLLGIARWRPAPVAAVAMSPWIDLALQGASLETRAQADPLLSRVSLAEAARQYLGERDPLDARASALSGDFGAMPPVRIHVGEDEVLLDDTLRFAAIADAAGRECDAHVWAGMVHVFPSNPALRAAAAALADIGAFLRDRLRPVAGKAIRAR